MLWFNGTRLVNQRHQLFISMHPTPFVTFVDFPEIQLKFAQNLDGLSAVVASLELYQSISQNVMFSTDLQLSFSQQTFELFIG